MFKKENPFNLKTILSLNIQEFGGDGGGEPSKPPTDPTPSNPNPEPTPNDLGATLSLDVVQNWLNEQEEGKKWLQSLTDSRVTEAIKTYETKTLPKKLEEEISKRFPPETEEQKQLRELKRQFERLEAEKQRESLKNKALSIATEKALPTKLVDYFIGNDEETTLKNLETFESIFSEAVQQAVEAKFKQGGRDPKSPTEPNQPLTKEAIEKMSPEEINANWDQIQAFLKGN